MSIDLRLYQSVDIAAIRTAYGQGKRAPVYVAPTGSGKGVVFTYIASELARRGKRAWILMHRQELISQTSRNLTAFGIDHGIISPQFSMEQTAPLQVASVQTLIRRLDRLAPPDLIIIDEGHHAVSPTYRAILNAHPTVKRLLVTATPERLDGRGLSEVADCLIPCSATTNELIDLGYLARPVCFAPPSLLDMTGVPKRGGDYAKEAAAERHDKPTITGDAIGHYQRICNGVPAIAFCVSVVHSEHVAAQFRAAGIRAQSVDGSMDDRQRKAAIGGLSTGTVQVLTSCDLVSEGLDCPGIGAAILLRRTQSLGMARQQIGRALRMFPGKKCAYILDHVGNLSHGLPTEEIEWSLEGGAAKKRSDKDKPAAVRQCSRCYRAYEAHLKACPECGFVEKTKVREINQVDGSLIEITEIEAFRRSAEKKKEQQRAKTLDELIAIGRKRGYRNPPAWARFIWLSRKEKRRSAASAK